MRGTTVQRMTDNVNRKVGGIQSQRQSQRQRQRQRQRQSPKKKKKEQPTTTKTSSGLKKSSSSSRSRSKNWSKERKWAVFDKYQYKCGFIHNLDGERLVVGYCKETCQDDPYRSAYQYHQVCNCLFCKDNRRQYGLKNLNDWRSSELSSSNQISTSDYYKENRHRNYLIRFRSFLKQSKVKTFTEYVYMTECTNVLVYLGLLPEIIEIIIKFNAIEYSFVISEYYYEMINTQLPSYVECFDYGVHIRDDYHQWTINNYSNDPYYDDYESEYEEYDHSYYQDEVQDWYDECYWRS